MITLKGENLLMNNLFKETKNHIKYIAMGNNNTTPKYLNQKLNNETIRKEANIKYDTNNRCLIVNADFDVADIEDACEIGIITNNNDLIAHDIFKSVPSSYDSTIHFEYRLIIETMYKPLNWKQTQYKGVYLTVIDDIVEAVYEKSTDAGYTPKNTVTDVQNTLASFYYNTKTKQLYIRTSNDIEPENLNIYVKTR